MTNTQQPSRLVRYLPWILIVAGLIGLISSIVLTHDQISVWQNPNFKPACSLNPVVSCGTVINSDQGHILGIPAPFFGLALFPLLMAFGAAILAGARFKRWLWLGLQAGATVGLAVAIWLFLTSVYRVHALCPYCLATDVAVYTAFWYITLANISEGIIKLPKSLKRAGGFARKHHLDILIIWFVLIFVFILHHFWYYYGKHL